MTDHTWCPVSSQWRRRGNHGHQARRIAGSWNSSRAPHAAVGVLPTDLRAGFANVFWHPNAYARLPGCERRMSFARAADVHEAAFGAGAAARPPSFAFGLKDAW